jgi:hypothetical protein
MFSYERTVDGTGGDESNLVEFCFSCTGDFENHPLNCSRSERNPHQIANHSSQVFRNRVGKRARVLVGKIDGYFGELHLLPAPGSLIG